MVKYSSLTADFLRKHGIYANFVFLGDDNNPSDYTIYLDAKPIFSAINIGKDRWTLEAFSLIPEVLKKKFERGYRGIHPTQLRRRLWMQFQMLSWKGVLQDTAYIAWEAAYLQDLCRILLNRNPAFAKDLLHALVVAAQSQFGEEDARIRTPHGVKPVSKLCGYSTIETQETDCLIWNRAGSNTVPTGLMRSILGRDNEKYEILATFSKGSGQSTLPYRQAVNCLTSRYSALIDPMVFYTALSERGLLDEESVHSAEAKRYLDALVLLMKHRTELHRKELSQKVLLPRF